MCCARCDSNSWLLLLFFSEELLLHVGPEFRHQVACAEEVPRSTIGQSGAEPLAVSQPAFAIFRRLLPAWEKAAVIAALAMLKGSAVSFSARSHFWLVIKGATQRVVSRTVW